MSSLPAVVGATLTALLPLCRVPFSSEQCISKVQLAANSARLFPGATSGLLAVCPEEQHSSTEPACCVRLPWAALGMQELTGGEECWAVEPHSALSSTCSLWLNPPVWHRTAAVGPQTRLSLAEMKQAWNNFKGIDVSALLACVISTLHSEAQFSQRAG